jgi:hypothetical protein
MTEKAKRISKALAAALIVFVSWLIVVYISFVLPGSPYRELPSIATEIERSNQSSASIQAFFRNSQQVNRYDATVTPLLVAVLSVVGLAALRATGLDAGAAIATYALLTVPFTGVCCLDVIKWNVLGVVVFAIAVLATMSAVRAFRSRGRSENPRAA